MKKSLKILIVEDNVIVAMDIQFRVEQLGCFVTDCVTKGEDAIESVKLNLPDLILMDIQLKGKMTGIEAAQIICAHHDTHIIFLSAFTDKTMFNKAQQITPLGYLSKPFSDQDLLELIKKLM